MSITKSDFLSVKVGDNFIDAFGNEWIIVNVAQTSPRIIRAHFMKSITLIQYINDTLVDSNLNNIEIYTTPRQRLFLQNNFKVQPGFFIDIISSLDIFIRSFIYSKNPKWREICLDQNAL